MASLSAAQRDKLPASAFAIPKNRQYPIHDAAHVKLASTELEAQHAAGKVPEAQYQAARGKIARAMTLFGVEDKTTPKRTPPGRRVLHIRADLADGGSLHVRHLKDGSNLLLPGGFEIPTALTTTLAAEGEASVALAALDASASTEAAAKAREKLLELSAAADAVWIQLGRPGYWAGHPQGPFSLNEAIFQQIKKNFEATSNHEIPVDFEHATEKGAGEGSIAQGGAPAQGWIREMKIAAGNLYGLVHWGDKAREMIRAKQYKYMSPAIRFASKDRETGALVGARMTSAALTNNPWIDGMQPVAAKDDGGHGAHFELKAPSLAFSPSEYMPRVKAALRLSELCTPQECSDHLARLRAYHDADLEGAQDGSPDGVHLDDYRIPLRSLVGATPAHTWDDVFDAVENMIDAAASRSPSLDDDGPPSAEGSASALTAITADDGPPEGDTMAATEEKNAATTIATLETANATLLSDKKTLTTATESLTADKKSLNDRIAAIEASAAAEKATLMTAATQAATDKTKLELAVQELTGNLAKLTEELKTLRDEKVLRDAATTTARVEKAFDQYKDKKNLTDASKKGMLLVLSNDPTYFETEYPLVKDSEAHLLHPRTVGSRPAAPPPMRAVNGNGTGAAPKVSLMDLTRTIAKEKGLSLSDASLLADEVWRRNRAAGDVTSG